MTTLQGRLDATHGRPSGFDYMRIILSVAVIAWHSMFVCYGLNSEKPFWTGPLRPLVYCIVPMFFALSGFLVAGSLGRNDLPSFLTLRALRIFPALVVEVILSAFILGPVLTAFSLTDYFHGPEFWRYFLNILGWIHYTLPGVLQHTPGPRVVNVQLWTVPYEMECYIGLTILALVKLHKRPVTLLSLVAIASVGVFAYQLHTGHHAPFDGRPPGRMLMLSFLAGVALYQLRERIKFNAAIFVGCLVLSWVLLTMPSTPYLASLPISYVTVYLGLLNPPRTMILKGADYSYGLYLYGFPVQQAIGYFFPSTRIWAVNFVLSLAVTSLFALLSWRLVESKVLDHKRKALAFVGAGSAWIKGMLPERLKAVIRAFFRMIGPRETAGEGVS